MPNPSYKPLLSPAPDPVRYADYRTWLRVCLKRLERIVGPGAKGMLATQMGCSGGHLSNIVGGERVLRAPYLENLAMALGLTDTQIQTLRLQVAAAHGRGRKKAQAAKALEDLQLSELPPLEPATSAAAAPLHQLTVEAFALFGGTSLAPRELAAQLWPPANAEAVQQLTANAIRDRSGRPLARLPPGPLVAEALPLLLDGLARARLALNGWPLGRRLLRSSLELTDEHWERDVLAALGRFQEATQTWARGLQPSAGAGRIAMVLGAQITPLCRTLAPSGARPGQAGLRFGSVVTTPPEGWPGVIDSGPPDQLPRTFHFDDYREYLIRWFHQKRALTSESRRPMTMGALAQRAGCNPSAVSSVLSRTRHLQEDRVGPMGEALKLTGAEAQDFELLWRYTLATEWPLEQARLLRLRMAIPGFTEVRPVQAAALSVMTSPLAFTLLELLRHPEVSRDPAALCGLLAFSAEPEEVSRSLAALERIGALASDEGGVLHPTVAQCWLDTRNRRAVMTASHLAHMERVAVQAQSEGRRVLHASQVVLVPDEHLDELIGRVCALHDEIVHFPALRDPLDAGGPWAARLLTFQVFPGSREVKL